MQESIQTAIRELMMWRSYQRSASVASWFTAQLYDLIAKADIQNREALRRGFKYEVMAYELWTRAESEDQFFAQFEKVSSEDYSP